MSTFPRGSDHDVLLPLLKAICALKFINEIKISRAL